MHAENYRLKWFNTIYKNETCIVNCVFSIAIFPTFPFSLPSTSLCVCVVCHSLWKCDIQTTLLIVIKVVEAHQINNMGKKYCANTAPIGKSWYVKHAVRINNCFFLYFRERKKNFPCNGNAVNANNTHRKMRELKTFRYDVELHSELCMRFAAIVN